MPKKLLLADDSVTIQRVIELTFADEDIQVIAVGDGQQAIARIDAEAPDVILADIGMPERDGYEVAAHVKENPQTAHIPVLLLTGAFEPIDEARAHAVGCDGVLVKPFEPQMVINRVKDLLAGRRPASLWSTPPGPTGTVVAPHAGSGAPPGIVGEALSSHSETAAAGTSAPAGADSLDEYFDRLDAAFSEGELSGAKPGPSAAATPPADHDVEFGTWDIPFDRPRQPGGQAEPAPVELEAGIPPAPPVHEQIEPGAETPELADAFAALLAAQQQFAGPAAPGGAAAPQAAPLDEAAIEAIVRRVLAQMTEDTVKATVLDVAERLVRAEIDRIKEQAKL